jgi:hypothetical protein
MWEAMTKSTEHTASRAGTGGTSGEATLTVQIAKSKLERLKEVARSRDTSVSRLIDETTTLLLAEFDAEARFRIRAARGKSQVARGLELLKKAQGL